MRIFYPELQTQKAYLITTYLEIRKTRLSTLFACVTTLGFVA